MRTLALRAGVLPLVVALPVLLLVLCIEWQARLARSAFADLPHERYGATLLAPGNLALASFSPADALMPAARRPQVEDQEPRAAARADRYRPAAAPAPSPASFTQRFAAAYGYYEPNDEAVVLSGDPVLSAPNVIVLEEAVPGSADDEMSREREADDGSRYEGHTAVYVIATHAVYLPNGERLEAHSGLGANVDNPNRVNVKNRGPTPPNVYNLVMREGRFHGVRAIRLIPLDEGKMYGRDGMLAHSYMLRGARAQSNGCVVFRDYPAFLAAFQRGDVRRLVVVDNLTTASAKPGAAPESVYKLAQAAARY
jgi:hypothetical protein